MTTTLHDVHPSEPLHDRPTRWWLVIGASALTGFALGVVARLWMRVITDDPEFSWSGTKFIVGAFVVFSVAQGASRLGRRARHRWVTSILRVVGAVGLLPLFVGAGAFMLPTVVIGGAVVHHPPRRRWGRVVMAFAAAVPFLSVVRGVIDSHGFGLRMLVGSLAIAVTYSAVIALARPTFAPNPRGLRVPKAVLVLGWVILIGLVAMFAVGLAFGG